MSQPDDIDNDRSQIFTNLTTKVEPTMTQATEKLDIEEIDRNKIEDIEPPSYNEKDKKSFLSYFGFGSPRKSDRES